MPDPGGGDAIGCGSVQDKKGRGGVPKGAGDAGGFRKLISEI